MKAERLTPVRGKPGQCFRLDALKAVTGRAEQMIATPPVQDGDAAFLLNKGGAHFFGFTVIAFKFRFPKRENAVKVSHKFTAIRISDKVEMADHPACVLKFPLIRHPDKAFVSGDVWEEGELAAAC